MGKKKKRRKVARKVEAFLESTPEITERELILAGLGTIASAVAEKKKTKKRRKAVDKAIASGRKLLEFDVPVIEALASDGGETGDRQPVIAYRSRGGGWYDIEVDGIRVDAVQGEESAAERAAELLKGFAALPEDRQLAARTEMRHVGGGWYELTVKGVPVGRIRGREEAEERFTEVSGQS